MRIVMRGVVKSSNWILWKFGQPKVFSILPVHGACGDAILREYISRYWMELREYLKNIPVRTKGKIPPIPLREVEHGKFHSYKATRPTFEVKEYDSCYMDPTPTITLTQEQWDECYNEAVGKDKDSPKGSWEAVENKEPEDGRRQD